MTPTPRRRLGAGAPWGAHPAILHLDIDAFFASIEQRLNPTLAGRPVAVGTGVVASASYEARAFGIRAGTPLQEARRRCPALIVLSGHAPTYQAFARRIFEIAGAYGPQVETFLDDAYVDLTGTERVHGHLIRAADALRRQVHAETGLTVSLGLATNRMTARMVTRLCKPDGFAWLRPGGESDFVAAQPLEDLPGIGHKRAAVLREMGLVRVADLRELPAARLRDLFGEIGLLLAARARGHDTRPVNPHEVPRSIRRETSFDDPVTRRDQLEGMLYYLIDRASTQARRLGVSPGRVAVHLRWADGGGDRRAGRVSADGAANTAGLFTAARELLAQLLTRRMGLRNLGVDLQSLHPERGRQPSLFDAPAATAAGAAAGTGAAAGMRAATGTGAATGANGESAPERLDAAVDDVRRRFGFRALVRGRSLELLGRLPRDEHGFVLRTPCLTK